MNCLCGIKLESFCHHNCSQCVIRVTYDDEKITYFYFEPKISISKNNFIRYFAEDYFTTECGFVSKEWIGLTIEDDFNKKCQIKDSLKPDINEILKLYDKAKVYSIFL